MPLTPETRKNIFETLKSELEKCCPPLVNNKSKTDVYEVIGNVPTPYGYKKVIVPGMYFASIVARNTNVSFYFFPIYMDAKGYTGIAPTLLKHLDGKTCFHFKKEEQVNTKELSAMLKKGIQSWKKMGYVK
ncbi:MAG: hypothetical protein JJE25_06465 [Bacteroidia bacterium]|nr:hypothetical protein [Bacteroidia bacterium]